MTKSEFRVFRADVVAAGLPEPVPEFRFHPVRRWRFDAAWPEHRVAIEQEGGVFKRAGGPGRHARGAGYRADLEKYNAAAAMGWRVLRFLPEQVGTRAALDVIRATLAGA